MGAIGQNVAKILENRKNEGINVKVIERSKDRAICRICLKEQLF